MDGRSRGGHTHSWKSTAIRGPCAARGERRRAPVGTVRASGEIPPIMRLIRVAFVVGSIVALAAAALAQAPAQPKAPARPGGGPGAASPAPEPGGEAKAVTQAILEEIDKRS